MFIILVYGKNLCHSTGEVYKFKTTKEAVKIKALHLYQMKKEVKG